MKRLYHKKSQIFKKLSMIFFIYLYVKLTISSTIFLRFFIYLYEETEINPIKGFIWKSQKL
jgi:hypothetical protein